MKRVFTAIAGAGLLALGCASVPDPKPEIAKAELAVRKAESVNAAELAPLDSRLARDKLEKAKLEQGKKNYLKARQLAEEAEVDALFAEATARSTRVQRSTDEKRNQVDELKRDMEGTR